MLAERSPLQIAMEYLLQKKGTVWLTGSQPENKIKYAEILFRTRPNEGQGKFIKLVCGELSPLLFNDESVVKGLEWALTDGAEIEVIFRRGNTPEEAKISLSKTNPRLFELIKQSQNIHVYWSPIRMKQHFLAISNSGVLFEKPEIGKSKRGWWAFFIKDSKLAEKWINLFNKYMQTGQMKLLPTS